LRVEEGEGEGGVFWEGREGREGGEEGGGGGGRVEGGEVEVGGVVEGGFAEDVEEVAGLGFDGAAGDGVPVLAVEELNPEHVDLDKGGASPLAGFEEDDADGAVGEAEALKLVEELALGAVEAERDVTALALGADADGGEGPVLEVEAGAEAVVREVGGEGDLVNARAPSRGFSLRARSRGFSLRVAPAVAGVICAWRGGREEEGEERGGDDERVEVGEATVGGEAGVVEGEDMPAVAGVICAWRGGRV
jgi:hypothetical protein